jgi:membrane protease YdiL (CAAX protease family)
MKELVILVNSVLLGAGGVIAAGWVILKLTSRQPRSLLLNRQPALTPDAPAASLVHLAIPLAVYLVIHSLFMMQLSSSPPDVPTQPGSHLWHLAQLSDAMSRLIAAMVMLQFLRSEKVFAAQPRHWSLFKTLRTAVPAALAATSVCVGLLTLSQWISPSAESADQEHPVLQAFNQSAWGIWGQVQLIVGAIVVAPLVEEFFFRGLVIRAGWVLSRNGWVAVLISGALFGLIHLSISPLHVVPLATLGIILAVIRIRTGSLLLCVLIHALFNLRPLMLLWFGAA